MSIHRGETIACAPEYAVDAVGMTLCPHACLFWCCTWWRWAPMEHLVLFWVPLWVRCCLDVFMSQYSGGHQVNRASRVGCIPRISRQCQIQVGIHSSRSRGDAQLYEFDSLSMTRVYTMWLIGKSLNRHLTCRRIVVSILKELCLNLAQNTSLEV